MMWHKEGTFSQLLPDYFRKSMNHGEFRALCIDLGQFTSHTIVGTLWGDGLSLEDIRVHVHETTDYEFGHQYLTSKIYVSRSGVRYSIIDKWQLPLRDMVQYEYEVICRVIGSAIRGRIPFAYTSHVYNISDTSPSQVSYEMAREFWGGDDTECEQSSWYFQ